MRHNNDPRRGHNVNGKEEQAKIVREILDKSKVKLIPNSYRTSGGNSLGSFAR